jgi:hypothetical protein
MIGVLASGCANAHMTKQSVIQAANRAAEGAGHRLANYKMPNAELVRPCGLDRREWLVSYDPRVALWATNQLGSVWVTNRLAIVVDDRTGAAQIAANGEPDR